MFSLSIFVTPSIDPARAHLPLIMMMFLISVFIFIEWLQREKQHALQIEKMKLPRLLRWTIYSFIIFMIGMYMPTSETPFIYFQF